MHVGREGELVSCVNGCRSLLELPYRGGLFAWMGENTEKTEKEREGTTRRPLTEREMRGTEDGGDEVVFLRGRLPQAFPLIPTYCLYYSSRSMLVHPLFKPIDGYNVFDVTCCTAPGS